MRRSLRGFGFLFSVPDSSVTSLPSLIWLGRAGYAAFGGSRRTVAKKDQKVTPKVVNDLPVLIPGSGKSQPEVEELIKSAAGNGRNLEFLHLHQNAYQKIGSVPHRGYGLLKPGESAFSVNTGACSGSARPVWMIFPGLGSQCSEMGAELMKITPYAESIRRSKKFASKFHVDLDAVLKPSSQVMFYDVHAALVALTAVQIALFDLFTAMGVKPDGLVGHSTGELMCAYADGCLRAKETLEIADAQGRACKQIKNGGMANVALSWDEAKQNLPDGLEIIGANGAQNVLISGKSELLDPYVETLTAQGKPAEVIASCGVPLHSSHCQAPADELKKSLRDKLKGERIRSSKWISTSIQKDQMKGNLAKCASSEYFENNLKSPVRFFEALQRIPSRAIIIEMSPKGAFQQILKESSRDCVLIAPMEPTAKDKLSHFYDSVGQLYMAGIDLDICSLYPQVADPVYKPVT